MTCDDKGCYPVYHECSVCFNQTNITKQDYREFIKDNCVEVDEVPNDLKYNMHKFKNMIIPIIKNKG